MISAAAGHYGGYFINAAEPASQLTNVKVLIAIC